MGLRQKKKSTLNEPSAETPGGGGRGRKPEREKKKKMGNLASGRQPPSGGAAGGGGGQGMLSTTENSHLLNYSAEGDTEAEMGELMRVAAAAPNEGTGIVWRGSKAVGEVMASPGAPAPKVAAAAVSPPSAAAAPSGRHRGASAGGGRAQETSAAARAPGGGGDNAQGAGASSRPRGPSVDAPMELASSSAAHNVIKVGSAARNCIVTAEVGDTLDEAPMAARVRPVVSKAWGDGSSGGAGAQHGGSGGSGGDVPGGSGGGGGEFISDAESRHASAVINSLNKEWAGIELDEDAGSSAAEGKGRRKLFEATDNSLAAISKLRQELTQSRLLPAVAEEGRGVRQKLAQLTKLSTVAEAGGGGAWPASKPPTLPPAPGVGGGGVGGVLLQTRPSAQSQAESKDALRPSTAAWFNRTSHARTLTLPKVSLSQMFKERETGYTLRPSGAPSIGGNGGANCVPCLTSLTGLTSLKEASTLPPELLSEKLGVGGEAGVAAPRGFNADRLRPSISESGKVLTPEDGSRTPSASPWSGEWWKSRPHLASTRWWKPEGRGDKSPPAAERSSLGSLPTRHSAALRLGKGRMPEITRETTPVLSLNKPKNIKWRLIALNKHATIVASSRQGRRESPVHWWFRPPNHHRARSTKALLSMVTASNERRRKPTPSLRPSVRPSVSGAASARTGRKVNLKTGMTFWKAKGRRLSKYTRLWRPKPNRRRSNMIPAMRMRQASRQTRLSFLKVKLADMRRQSASTPLAGEWLDAPNKEGERHSTGATMVQTIASMGWGPPEQALVEEAATPKVAVAHGGQIVELAKLPIFPRVLSFLAGAWGVTPVLCGRREGSTWSGESLEFATLGRLSQACKALRHGVRREVRHVDLGSTREDQLGPGVGALLSGVARSLPGLRSVDLSHCRQVADTGLHELSRCRGLVSVNLEGCSSLGDPGVCALALSCRELRELSVEGVAEVTDASCRALGASCALLRGLSLRGCHLVTDRGLTHLSGCRKLRRLSLRSLRAVTDAGLRALAAGARLLCQLDLGGCSSITDSGVAALARSCPHLRDLNLYLLRRVTDQGVEALAAGCKKISVLNLDCLERLTDVGVQHLSRLPELARLQMRGCPHVTPVAVADAVGRCPKLHAREVRMHWSSTETRPADVDGGGGGGGVGFNTRRNSRHMRI